MKLRLDHIRNNVLFPARSIQTISCLRNTDALAGFRMSPNSGEQIKKAPNNF